MKKRGKPRSGNQDPEYHPRIIRYYAISEYSGLILLGEKLSFPTLRLLPSSSTTLQSLRGLLASMGLPTDVPPIARARSPDFYQESFPADWD